MTSRSVYKPCTADTNHHQPITNRILNMGNLHLVCFAMALILTVVQLGKETVTAQAVTTTTTTKAPTTTATKATTTTVPAALTKPTKGNGSIKHGLSPLILMCGILAKLFLSA